MCLSFLFYYPKVDNLSVALSVIHQEELIAYLSTLPYVILYITLIRDAMLSTTDRVKK